MNKVIFSLSLILLIAFSACNEKSKKVDNTSENQTAENNTPFFKISLAEWSLSGPIRNGEMNPMDFAQKANEMGFEAVEYVSQLYTKTLEAYPDQNSAMDSLVAALKSKSDQYGVENVLIMIDNEGDLSSSDLEVRDAAVEKHKKWIDAATTLGCHAVRVNLNGATEEQAWKEASIDGLTKLSEYAANTLSLIHI